MIYWIVVLGGGAVAVSGYLLMFPFYATDIAGMQLAQIVHGVVAVLFVAAMLGHIYIGTIGMEGAFEAMGDGTVDVNWAKQHHSLWAGEGNRQGPGQRPAAGRTHAGGGVARRRPMHAPAVISRARQFDGSRTPGSRWALRPGAPACYSAAMRIIGLAGWSGSGKTTLLDQGASRA